MFGASSIYIYIYTHITLFNGYLCIPFTYCSQSYFFLKGTNLFHHGIGLQTPVTNGCPV